MAAVGGRAGWGWGDTDYRIHRVGAGVQKAGVEGVRGDIAS